MTDDYQRRFYGEISVGTGEKPGIVVVDFQLGFTDPQYPLGGAPLVMRALENTARLLEVARRVGAPVAVCNTVKHRHRLSPVVAFRLVLLGFRQAAVTGRHLELWAVPDSPVPISVPASVDKGTGRTSVYYCLDAGPFSHIQNANPQSSCFDPAVKSIPRSDLQVAFSPVPSVAAPTDPAQSGQG